MNEGGFSVSRLSHNPRGITLLERKPQMLRYRLHLCFWFLRNHAIRLELPFNVSRYLSPPSGAHPALPRSFDSAYSRNNLRARDHVIQAGVLLVEARGIEPLSCPPIALLSSTDRIFITR